MALYIVEDKSPLEIQMNDDLINVLFSIKDLKAGMSSFRNKPVNVFAKRMNSSFEIDRNISIKNHSGKAGDWLIVTSKDEIYASNNLNFCKFYEEIETEGETEGETERKIERISITKNDMKEGVSIFRRRPLQVSAKKIHYYFSVETKEGLMAGRPGDWVIKEFYGELSFCRDEDFQNFYQYEQPEENSDKDP